MPLLKHVLTSALALMSSLPSLKAVSNPLAVTISNTQTVSIPSTLYGWMWEDINHSCDGGLYGELLQNRAFQAVTAGTSAALNAWQAIGGTTLSVVGSGGVSTALPNNLAVTVPSSASGTVGFQNTGFFGIKVQSGWTYTGSFYAKSSSFTGPLTVALKSTSGTTFASATVTGVTSSWKKFTFSFTPSTSASNINNVFTVTFSGAAGKSLNFGLFSLFPPTFKGRTNGMRMDLAQALADTKPGVWRFPGGNNLEGNTWDTRWKWNETIGPLENRPGRQGDWGYANTDGVGLMEYLQWAEDIGATPILGVWDGLSLGSNPVVPQNQLQPYIDDVINELEFITADASSNQWGALRASLGRTQPYALKYVEIGNEDFFQSASYQSYRWPMFVNQLSAKFPNLEFLATTYPNTALTPAYKKIDFHQYNVPSWFTSNAFMWDTYPRNGTQWFVGEYAVISTNSSDVFGTPATGRLTYPTVQGSVAEAAFMTGMERNADVVFASAYAPTLQHISSTQWTPDIITFDAGSMVKSTSYYVQQMFGTNTGTHVLQTTPVSSTSTTPLYYVASRNDQGTVFVKVVNAGTGSQTINFTFGFSIPSKSGTATTLSSPTAGNYAVSNTLTSPNVVVPVTSTFTMSSTTAYSRTFAANTVTVLVFSTSSTGGTTPTSTTSSSAPSNTSGGQAAHYAQCGGQGWTGPTTCVAPYTCTYSNQYYSQCL